MMKKSIIFMATILLSGCSMWNSWNWDWNVLNPWADSKDETAVAPSADDQKAEVLMKVNPYLWQACLEKLSFMGIASKDQEEGRIATDWISLSSAPNEKFKIVAEIDGAELRADALDIKVYKEIKGKSGWIKAAPSDSFENEIEQAVIKRAKMLYISDKE